MDREFHQIVWDESLQDDCRQLVRLAIREDLDRRCDVTTVSLVDRSTTGQATMMARQGGVICGLRAAQLVLDEMDCVAEWTSHIRDGESVSAATPPRF